MRSHARRLILDAVAPSRLPLPAANRPIGMQPIERYGLVTLLFVIVAVVAVLAWDGPEAEPAELDETARVTEDASRAEAERRAAQREAEREAEREAARLERQREKEKKAAAERERLARANSRTTPPVDGAADRTPTGGYNPFGGSTGAADASFVSEVADTSGLSGLPANGTDTRRDTSAIDGIRGPRGVEEARSSEVAAAPSVALDGLADGARASQPVSLVERSTTTGDRASTTLPTGPFVVDAVLSKQLAREYGPDYALFGSNGLVAAFEAANPGVNVDRLGVGDTLRRPAPQRVAAALKGAAVASTSGSQPVAGAASTASTTTVGGAPTYVIQSGDTLSGIALRTLGSASAFPRIEALNPGIDANKLRVGDTILLPAGADPAARRTEVASNASSGSSQPASSDRPRIR